MLLFADTNDYFARVGLEPFVAYACLCSVLLNQASIRKKLNDYATFDHLTGLLNRRALAEILEREHVRAERYNRRYSLLFFDMDRFKRINDNYGHNVGDMALQEVARIANRVLREGDWIGRWGGEEFLCVLPDASEGEAEKIAHRLRAEVVNAPLTIPGEKVALSVSIGVACFPQDGIDINTLLVHADEGLKSAKRKGRNCVERYSPAFST
jgi:diguanylate cyclase (GGDEF)-like protein